MRGIASCGVCKNEGVPLFLEGPKGGSEVILGAVIHGGNQKATKVDGRKLLANVRR